MLFRCSYTVRLRIDLKEGETLVLAEPAPRIRVTLQGLGERDVPETGTPLRQLCVVTEKIDDPGDDHPCASVFAQQAGGSFSSLPADCQAFIDVLIERLDDRARHCLSLLRWRYGIEGPQYAWEFRRQAEWSIDGQRWHEFPGRIPHSCEDSTPSIRQRMS